MNLSNGDLDCQLYLSAAQTLIQQIEDIPFISVQCASLSNDIAMRKVQSRELCRAAVVNNLKLNGILVNQDCGIWVEKSIWGQPYIVLADPIRKQIKEKSIDRLLVTMTNDCDKLLCIAAAVQSNEFSIYKPLGIGVDLLCHNTIVDLFTDCSFEVLSHMFFRREINYASKRKDELIFSKMVSVKEAVFKSISEAFHHSGINLFSSDEIKNASFQEIEVMQLTDNLIETRLHGQLAEIAKYSGVQNTFIKFVSGKNFTGSVAISTGKLISNYR